MRSNGRGCAVLLVSLLTGLPSLVQGQSIESEVGGFLERYVEALDARDVERIRASIVSDGRFAWVEDGEVRYRSADDLLTSLAQFPAGRIQTVLSGLTVASVGDSAAHAWTQFRTRVGEGPSSFEFSGAISFVLEKEDGSWKLVGGHTSAPRPR